MDTGPAVFCESLWNACLRYRSERPKYLAHLYSNEAHNTLKRVFGPNAGLARDDLERSIIWYLANARPLRFDKHRRPIPTGSSRTLYISLAETQATFRLLRRYVRIAETSGNWRDFGTILETLPQPIFLALIPRAVVPDGSEWLAALKPPIPLTEQHISDAEARLNKARTSSARRLRREPGGRPQHSELVELASNVAAVCAERCRIKGLQLSMDKHGPYRETLGLVLGTVSYPSDPIAIGRAGLHAYRRHCERLAPFLSHK